MPKKKLTLFERYVKEVKRLLALAQIGGDWCIDFSDNEEDDCLAAIDWNITGRWACFSFSSEQHQLFNACPLKSARHEFGHFVVAKLDELAKRRYITPIELYEVNEEIARIFETILSAKDEQ